jgi:ribosomal protein S18 acetylase RimI-like enzyme
MREISIRDMRESDCEIISSAFASQGWNKPVEQFRVYFSQMQSGARDVLIACWHDEFAGYVTIMWQSTYPPFQESSIPEIVDFNVLQKFQRRSVGASLMDEAERRIALRSPVAGIGVGLTADYGAAQILYIKRGYLPDGRGVFQSGEHLAYHDNIFIDDSLALYLTKTLKSATESHA